MSESSEIVQVLVGLKDVRVLHYARRGFEVELVIEQVVTDRRCAGCGGPARVKERPLVGYVDLPAYGTPMRLGWRKHRMCCPGGCTGPSPHRVGLSSLMPGIQRIQARSLATPSSRTRRRSGR